MPVLALAALALAAIQAGPASAATVSASGTTISISDPAGVPNALTVTTSGSTVTITDAATTLIPRAGCRIQLGRVSCVLPGAPSALSIDLGGGDDALTLNSDLPATIHGGPGNDVITGGNGPDTIDAGPGGDTVMAGPGDDRVAGGDDADSLDLGPGDDVVDAGAGDDNVDGGEGADRGVGGEGADSLGGGAGDDGLAGGGGDDIVDGGDGLDRLAGGPGRDLILGGADEDRVWARESEFDRVDCGDGTDLIDPDGIDKLRSCERFDLPIPTPDPEIPGLGPIDDLGPAGTVGGLRRIDGGGRIVPIPGFPWARLDGRLLPDIRYLRAKYHILVGDGYSLSSAHVRDGEHPIGAAVDIVPGPGGSWDDVDRLAKWAEPTQNHPRLPFRWVGYDGDKNHGRGNHLHLSWEHGPARYGHPAAWVLTFAVHQVQG